MTQQLVVGSMGTHTARAAARLQEFKASITLTLTQMHVCLRSPLLNKELMKVSDLRHIYTSAFNRIGRLVTAP